MTRLPAETASGTQIVLLYRKRADAENVFDELKNQWGFSGFCSHMVVVSEAAALSVAGHLQSLDPLRAREGVHTEAVTSRDELLLIPAKLVQGDFNKH